MEILIITPERRTSYDNRFFLTRENNQILQVIRVSDQKIVDEIFLYRGYLKGDRYEAIGEELN